MITSRITTFLATIGFFGMASFASAKEKPDAGMSEYAQGIQFFEKKQYEQAVTEFTKAILANGKQPAFYENRDFASVAPDRARSAAAGFSKAIERAAAAERGE